MAFSFASAGHAIGSALQDVAKGAEWLIKEAQTVVQPTEKGVESVTALIAQFLPQANMALIIEKVGYGALGIIIAGLQSGDAAFRQNLLNAGADESFIQQVEAIIEAFPALISGAKAQFEAQSPATTAATAKASLASVHTITVPKGAAVVDKTPASPVSATVEKELHAGLAPAATK
jgi:hypothetical protein